LLHHNLRATTWRGYAPTHRVRREQVMTRPAPLARDKATLCVAGDDAIKSIFLLLKRKEE